MKKQWKTKRDAKAKTYISNGMEEKKAFNLATNETNRSFNSQFGINWRIAEERKKYNKTQGGKTNPI